MAQVVKTDSRFLRSAYETGSSGRLNAQLREALGLYATSEGLQFAQDRVGNTYITTPGCDPGLAGIGIEFPLDENHSVLSFNSALAIFSLLRKLDLPSSLTLVGWTTIRDRVVGRDCWESSSSNNEESNTAAPEMEQFSGMSDPVEFAFSALFEVVQNEDEPLSLAGSPVLVDMARKLLCGGGGSSFGVAGARPGERRAPAIHIRGSGSEKVARDLVEGYSRYIAALFDNFD